MHCVRNDDKNTIVLSVQTLDMVTQEHYNFGKIQHISQSIKHLEHFEATHEITRD